MKETIKVEKIKASHRNIYTDIIIDASAEQVWSVIKDTTTYKNWSVFLTDIQGELKDGTKITAEFLLKPSKHFTHIHQLKSVNEQPKSKPIITLTPRKGNPDQLELWYANGPQQAFLLKSVNLDLFKGRWVQVIETVTYNTIGLYEINIIDIKTGKTLLKYKSKKLSLWQKNTSFI